MKRVLVYCLSTFTGLFWFGCASVPMADSSADAAAKRFTLLPDKAQIYVVRASMVGGGMPITVSIGDMVLGGLATDTYLVITLPPGLYRLKGEMAGNRGRNIRPFKVEAGTNYFVKLDYEIKYGVGAAFTPLSEEEGKKLVSSCRLAKLR